MLIAASRVISASGTALGAKGVLAPGYVSCEDGKIAAVGTGPPPRHPDVVLPDGVLLPGFVDLQVNGYFGVELDRADAVGWATVASRLAETGTTAFLPTFITCPLTDMIDSLRRTAATIPDLMAGHGQARVLGIHLEGPFISAKRAGAHNTKWIRKPD